MSDPQQSVFDESSLEEALKLLGNSRSIVDRDELIQTLTAFIEERNGATRDRLELLRRSIRGLSAFDLQLLEDLWTASEPEREANHEPVRLPTEAVLAADTLLSLLDSGLHRMKNGEDGSQERTHRLLQRLQVQFERHHGPIRDLPYYYDTQNPTPLQEWWERACAALPAKYRPGLDTLRIKGTLKAIAQQVQREGSMEDEEVRTGLMAELSRINRCLELEDDKRGLRLRSKAQLIDALEALDGRTSTRARAVNRARGRRKKT